MPTPRRDRSHRKRPAPTLPTRFRVGFFEHLDQRLVETRKIRERYELLQLHANADSLQKQFLCQRFLFLWVKLESAEFADLRRDNDEDDLILSLTEYVALLNACTGVLRLLGVKNQQVVDNVLDLDAYLASHGADDAEEASP